MRVDFSPDYSNTIHRKRKLPSKIGYRVETSHSRDWITRNSNVEKKGRKGANHISLSLTSTHTYTHTHNVYSRCNEILSNYPSDHVSTPRVAVRPRMGEISARGRCGETRRRATRQRARFPLVVEVCEIRRLVAFSLPISLGLDT